MLFSLLPFFLKCIKFIYCIFSMSSTFFLMVSLPFWYPIYLYVQYLMRFLRFISLTKNYLKSFFGESQCKLHYYAVIKQNGKYLKNDDESCLLFQFYDYTARKCLAVTHLERQMKVVEIQCENVQGLQFLKKKNILRKIKGFSSNKKLTDKYKKSEVKILFNEYEIQDVPQSFDCMFFFDFKEKIAKRKIKSLTLLKILRYCIYNIDENGYLILGDYFLDQQIEFFIKVFNAYGFKVSSKEDISKNLEYGSKIRKKEIKEWEFNLFNNITEKIDKIVGKIPQGKSQQKFHIFILQKQIRPKIKE